MGSKKVAKKPTDRFTRRVNRMHKRYSKKRRGTGIPFSAMDGKSSRRTAKRRKKRQTKRARGTSKMARIPPDVSLRANVCFEEIPPLGCEGLDGDTYECKFFRYYPAHDKHLSRSLKHTLTRHVSTSEPLLLATLSLTGSKKRKSLEGEYRVFLPETVRYPKKEWDANHIYLYMQLLKPSFPTWSKHLAYSRQLFRLELTEGNSAEIKRKMTTWLHKGLEKAEKKLAFSQIDTNKGLPLIPTDISKLIAEHLDRIQNQTLL